MYLAPETIAGFLFDICDLHTPLPIIRSNWGKHTGTIWPVVLASYVIRRHVGDNPSSDVKVPSGFGIACELVQDSQPTAWEMKLQELALRQLALIQREGAPAALHPAWRHAIPRRHGRLLRLVADLLRAASAAPLRSRCGVRLPQP